MGDGKRVCGGRVIETFVFGIVKVCEDGKMVLKRRTDINDDFKLRNYDSRGKELDIDVRLVFLLSRLHVERSGLL